MVVGDVHSAMRRSLVLPVVALGGVAVAGAWSLYQRYATETVPATTVARVGDAELRRYPTTIHVETVAPSEREAFGRLFRYISGANRSDAEIAMTAPVELGRRGEAEGTREETGTEVPMTAPVEVGDADEGVRMAFVLPAEYDAESAPRPTDPAVDLVVVPERTLAVRRFSGRRTDRRVARETERLLATLSEAEVPVVGDPFFMGYDAPWTLPPLRRNEVAVEVDAAE